MPNFIKFILDMFEFSVDQYMVASVCTVVLLGNLCGGLLANLIVAFSGPRRTYKLKDKISFRLVMLSNVSLILFAGFYHVAVLKEIGFRHVVYWCSTLTSAPLLGYIGAQITYLIFAAKIDANRLAYKKWELRRRQAHLKRQQARQGANYKGPERRRNPAAK